MALWLADQPLLLASKSGSRRALLQGAGIPIEVLAADIDERGIETKAGLADPSAVAALLAREKAMAVSVQQRGRLVLGADQTLALGQRRILKAGQSRGCARPAQDIARTIAHAAFRGRDHPRWQARLRALRGGAAYNARLLG